MTLPTPPPARFAGIWGQINLKNLPTPAQLKGHMNDDSIIESKGLATRTPGELAPIVGTMDPVLEKMMSLAKDAASMKDVLDMYRTLQQDKSKVLFREAMTAFKEQCPPIPRRTENRQFKVWRNGVETYRKYATLEDMAATIKEPLRVNGLDYRWGNCVFQEGKLVMPCIVSHIGGHSEESSVVVPATSNAGCSPAQMYGAAMAYAQRFSLAQALGLTMCDEDPDGEEPKGGNAPSTINEHQAANLTAKMDELGLDRAKVLKPYGVTRVDDLPAINFVGIMDALEARARSKK